VWGATMPMNGLRMYVNVSDTSRPTLGHGGIAWEQADLALGPKCESAARSTIWPVSDLQPWPPNERVLRSPSL
jgi:hypothetical protein